MLSELKSYRIHNTCYKVCGTELIIKKSETFCNLVGGFLWGGFPPY